MKKSTKTVLLAACALILTGAVICACAFAAVDFDIYRLSTPEDATREWQLEAVPSDGIDRIRVNAAVDSIRVCSSGSDEIYMTYYTSQYGSYELRNENGELSLEYVTLKDRKWYEYITVDFSGIHSDENSVEICIPVGYDGEVYIETTAGDMELVNLEIDGALCAKSTTGHMEIYNVRAASVEASVTTGDMELEQVVTSAGDISVSYVTGAVRLENLSSAGAVRAEGTTGDINMYIIQAETVTAECTTGTISGYSVLAGSTVLRTTTGDISVDMRGSAEDYTVSANAATGDTEVEGSARANGDKRVIADATTGSVRIGFAADKN